MCQCGCNEPSRPSSGTSATSPCNGTTHLCPSGMIHGQLRIIEVDFSSNHVVEKDTLGNFGSPEWRDGRSAVDQSPVCYTRNALVPLTAKFRVTRQPSVTETIEVKGTATFGSITLEWTSSVPVSPSDTEVSTPSITSNVSLPNHVGHYDPLSINWTYNPANTGWSSAGTTDHVFYVVLDSPTGTPAYWTLLDISCRAAHGETTQSGIVSKCFVPFTGRSLTRKRDGIGLTYWNPDTTNATNTQQIFARSDGSGQCGSWSEFLIDMYKCHGITGADKILIVRDIASHSTSTVGFLVKNWNFIGSGSQPPPYTHVSGTECVDRSGVPGQRNSNPPPAFYNHFIVKFGSEFYDPSYGVGPVSSQQNWRNGAIDGLFSGGNASKGFVDYTVTAGDTLTKIAADHGIPSWSSLYNHPYNATFKGLRPDPNIISTGDRLYIPREISTVNLLEFWNLRTSTRI